MGDKRITVTVDVKSMLAGMEAFVKACEEVLGSDV